MATKSLFSSTASFGALLLSLDAIYMSISHESPSALGHYISAPRVLRRPSGGFLTALWVCSAGALPRPSSVILRPGPT